MSSSMPRAGEARSEAVLGRELELTQGDRFLDLLAADAAILLLRGEAGIGKTTLWQEIVAAAHGRGVRVLSCRPAHSETRLGYAGITDLLRDVDDEAFAHLPEPQATALAAALLRSRGPGRAVDGRAVSAGFLSLLGFLSRDRPVVVAVDDLQWLDGASARTLEFAARRLAATRVGLLLASRREELGAHFAANDGLPVPVSTIDLGPLSLGALRQLLHNRLDFSPPRPLLLRIHRASGGNPFFALEIVRSLQEDVGPAQALPLPDRLRDVVAERIERLPPRTRGALLPVAALADPTLELLERAGARRAALEAAADAGVVEIRRDAVRFTHPLLAQTVYSSVPMRRRRELHRRLAAVVTDPEERARHLALGTSGPDGRVAEALERAAARARARGAPDAAAELLEQSVLLTPSGRETARLRRVFAAAEDYFYAGARAHARELLEALLAESLPPGLRSDSLRLLAEIRYYDDSWPAAVPLLEEALAAAGNDLRRRIRVALDLCFASFSAGDIPSSKLLSDAVLQDAETLGDPALLAQALAASASVDLQAGNGVDEAKIERALDLEQWDERTVVVFRPSWQAAQIALFAGDVVRAAELYARLRENLVAYGHETDLPGIAMLSAVAECHRGNLRNADTLAREAVEMSLELDSRTARGLALAARGLTNAYLGRVEEAESDCEATLALFAEVGYVLGSAFPIWALGFLALSRGDAAEADRRMRPLAEFVKSMGLREPMVVPFLPDEIEALVQLGDLEAADELLELLERQGRALDRAWALATGARCRGLMLAARGELAAALTALERALLEHDRLEMPFELGRTLLAVGQVRRRLRQKRLAGEALESAKRLFDEIGTPLWADKAAGELQRLGLRRAKDGLSETEQRVAALAAAGLTNREIAARLFISPKTVQANLRRVYEKLGVHSRAELGASVARSQLAET